MSIDIEELLETFPEEARQAWRNKTDWQEPDRDLLPCDMCPKYPWQDTDHDEDDDFGWRISVIRYRWVIKKGQLSLKVWHLECYDTEGYDCQSLWEAEEPPETIEPSDFDDVGDLYESVSKEANSHWQRYYQWVARNLANPLEAEIPQEA